MAKAPIKTDLERSLEATGDGITSDAEQDNSPIYQILGDSRIPVSKHMGKLWESRKDQGLSARDSAATAWDEAIRYYDNDQMSHRTSADNQSSNRAFGRRINNQWTETENLVFSNCSIMVPMLYAKNPTVTVSHTVEAQEGFAKATQQLANKLIRQKDAPGLNFKSKMRRVVLTALLTNCAIIKIGWIRKQDSSEEAVAELQKLSQELEKAKGRKEIQAVEGRLMALEEKISLLSPAGPLCSVLLPHRLVRDPSAESTDLSDDNWVMEWDYLPTDYINAVYGKMKEGKMVSVYEPTHVLHSGSGHDIDDVVNNFKLLDTSEELKAATHGYSNPKAFQSACHTKVWYVWDKVTRRVYLFVDNNWQWPVWVWDDPLQLPRFFPYYVLSFHESTHANSPKGEVTYYLDQQDAINDINDSISRARRWSRNNIFYNKNVLSQNDAEQVLKGDDGTARGVDVPEGMKISDVLQSVIPPALNRPELYSIDSKLMAINRITGINDAMRGAQFKTNTTNKAVEAYNQNVDIRVDERTDLIEDFIGDVVWGIIQLACMNWDAEDVAPYIGADAENWKRVNDPNELTSVLSCTVEGGSTQKPNSTNKKDQAMKVGQVLGQFASGAPMLIIPLLKAFERAFDDTIVLTDEDWNMIIESIQMALTKAGSGPGGEEEPTDPNAEPATSDEQLEQQIAQRIQQLPPQAQQELEALVQQGMPPSEALEQIEAALQRAAQQ